MRMLVKVTQLVIATTLCACPSEGAFRPPPIGSPCEDFGGYGIPNDDPAAQEQVFCDRGHVTRVVSYDEQLRADDVCDGLEVRGDGLCIDLCFTRTQPALNGVERICLTEDVPAYTDVIEPWDQTEAGCDVLFDASPENGQPCVGTDWGCAGILRQPGVPSGFGWEGAIWCEEGTLRVVPSPLVHLGETIFRD
jgi:hypothetical protein